MADQDLDNLSQQIPEPVPDREVTQADQEQPPQPSLSDRIQDAQNTYDQGKDALEQAKKARERLSDWQAKRAEKKVVQSGEKKVLKGAEEKAVKQALSRKVVARGGQAAGKAAVQAGARVAGTAAGEAAVGAGAAIAGEAAGVGAGVAAGAGAGAAAGTVAPVVGNIIGLVVGAIAGFIAANAKKIFRWVKRDGWKWIAYPIAVLFLIIAIPFALLAGQELPQYPSTTAQKAQATAVAAIASDPLATKAITTDVAAQEKASYTRLINSAKAKFPAQAAGAQIRVNEIVALMESLINLQGEPRKTLLAQILDKRKALAKDFPEIFAAGGNCGQLAPFLYSGQFKIINGPNGKYIIEGKIENQAHQFNPASQEMCQALLIGLRAGYKITAEDTIQHDQKNAGGGRSLHWCGGAFDIFAINGHAVNGGNKDAEAISKLWYESSQNGSVFIQELIMPAKYRQYGVYRNKPHKFSNYIQVLHEDHIHLGGRLAPGACS